MSSGIQCLEGEKRPHFQGFGPYLAYLSLADIFPDIHGNLAGESIVQSSVVPPARTFRYTKNTQGLAEEVGDTEDWRGLIHATDDTTHTRVCISAAAPST